ncbi:tetratricopeptide repeat protein [Lujinxingia vulgaris]|uniref:Tetratricopeptide repeat protein n=1 Tax=Lujinxingia vulgaris TaxID=2600176 RepID=A0A5C6XAD4_9DELT|nr:tetratricopeptide repeat protein [Lujinxingia vulgaris]TXD38846.1 tetratricopeptide repeat protein [Lujinxingia vulgaris]
MPMDVSCPQCQTLYEFDEAQLRSVGSVNLKCSQCDHLFRLEVPEELRDESQRRWMVRKASSGDVLYFWGFDELHRWIMTGEVEAHDAISRTGERWSELGSLGEFAPVFQAVASIAGLGRAERRDPMEDRATQSFGAASTPARPRQSTTPHHDAARPPAKPGAAAPPREEQPTPAPLREARATPRQPVAEESVAPAPRSPGLNLDAERFGPASAAPEPDATRRRSPGRAPHLTPVGPEDDDWSLGDLSVTQSGSQMIVAPERRVRRSRGPALAVLLVLLLAGAGAGAWYAGYLDAWLKGDAGTADASETQALAEDQAPDSDARSTPVVSAADRVVEARHAARRAAHLPVWVAAVAEAVQKVGAASERSERVAQKSQRPDIDAVLASARRALQRGDAQAARARYHRATEIDESNPEAITGLGWALLELGSLDSAVAQFRRAIYRDATYGDAYIGLGRAERDRGNIGAAIEAYQTYLARLPNGPQASIARFQSEQLRRSSGLE